MLSRRQLARVVSAGLPGAVSPGRPAIAATLTTAARPSDVRFAVIDAQYGGEIGLVVHRRGTESLVLAGPERVVADRFQILTPHFGGLLWYDATGRWVKGSLELRSGVDRLCLRSLERSPWPRR
jgi:hypothetical protein